MFVLNAEPEDYSKKAVQNWINGGFNYAESNWDEIEKTVSFPNITHLIVRLERRVDDSIVNKFPSLTHLISATTGHDHIDLDVLDDRAISLISLRGHNDFLKTIPSTPELAFGLLLALIRNIPQANLDVRKGNWKRNCFRGYQLKNKNIGIVGLGRTGRLLAGYADAFGMKVGYYDPNVTEKKYSKSNTLQDLLMKSDIISLHIHLTDATQKLINSENIQHLKKDALLINTSRGNVWDEKEIAEALSKRKIAGVATDVLSTELDDVKSSPLWIAQNNDKNVIITPHIGGATFDAMWACEEYLSERIVQGMNQ